MLLLFPWLRNVPAASTNFVRGEGGREDRGREGGTYPPCFLTTVYKFQLASPHSVTGRQSDVSRETDTVRQTRSRRPHIDLLSAIPHHELIQPEVMCFNSSTQPLSTTEPVLQGTGVQATEIVVSCCLSQQTNK